MNTFRMWEHEITPCLKTRDQSWTIPSFICWDNSADQPVRTTMSAIYKH